MQVLAFSIAALFAIAPAFADDAVIVPNDNGQTVIHDHGLTHDKTTIIEHRMPDAVVVPEDHSDVTVSPDNGPSSGDTGVDIETHEHEPTPPPDDGD